MCITDVYFIKARKRRNIGLIKILAEGHENTATYFEQIGRETAIEGVVNLTEKLHDNAVVSLATDLDYYHKLRKVFNSEDLLIKRQMTLLCDAGLSVDLLDEYKTWEGFSGAILRDGSSALALVKKGAKIALGGYEIEDQISIELNNLPDTFEPVALNFDTSGDIFLKNISVLVGKNGVGKTHILEKLVESVSGVGDGGGEWYCFNKLLIASYSPFEKFKTEKQILIEPSKSDPMKLLKQSLLILKTEKTK